MELKAFVKTALNDIMDAICEAVDERNKNDKPGLINPKVFDPEDMMIDFIKFDVAVSAGSREGGGVQGGLEVLGFQIGAKGERQAEASSVSRIEFTLDVSWPYQSVHDAKKLTRR